MVETIATQVQSEQCSLGDCAIMYRTNAQSRSLEEAFIRAGLPYRLLGATRFYARREVKDLLAFLRLPRHRLAPCAGSLPRPRPLVAFGVGCCQKGLENVFRKGWLKEFSKFNLKIGYM